jgi:hypothetical protein
LSRRDNSGRRCFVDPPLTFLVVFSALLTLEPFLRSQIAYNKIFEDPIAWNYNEVGLK